VQHDVSRSAELVRVAERDVGGIVRDIMGPAVISSMGCLLCSMILLCSVCENNALFSVRVCTACGDPRGAKCPSSGAGTVSRAGSQRRLHPACRTPTTGHDSRYPDCFIPNDPTVNSQPPRAYIYLRATRRKHETTEILPSTRAPTDTTSYSATMSVKFVHCQLQS
jgi:hypothetical protein